MYQASDIFSQMVDNESYVGTRAECGVCSAYDRAELEWEQAYSEAYNARMEEIRNDYEDEYDDCAEFVSPILRKWHSPGAKAILDSLANEPQNDTAGIHIHVEAGDLSKRHLHSLLYGYNRIENLLVSSYMREEREYCEPWNAREFRDVGRDLKRDKLYSFGDRYLTLNLNALQAHGTVEFRALGPVYDYGYVIRWAMLCRS